MLFAMLMNSKGQAWMERGKGIISNPYFNTGMLLFHSGFDAQLCSFIPTIHTFSLTSHISLLLLWHRSHILSKTFAFFCTIYLFTCTVIQFYLPTQEHVSRKTVFSLIGCFLFCGKKEEVNSVLFLNYCLVHLQIYGQAKYLWGRQAFRRKTLTSDSAFLSQR